MQKDPYVELLKQVISGHFHRENGMRILELLDVGYGLRPLDVQRVIDVRSHSADTLAAIAADPDEQGNYRERIFGFPYSMLGQKRLYNIEAVIRTILREGISGHFLEAGVWRGGACIFARLLLDHLEPQGGAARPRRRQLSGPSPVGPRGRSALSLSQGPLAQRLAGSGAPQFPPVRV